MNRRLAVFHDLTSGQANKGFQQAALWEVMLAALLLDCCDVLQPTWLPSSLCLTAAAPPSTVRSCRVVHRCGEEILKRELPPKHEVVLKLALTPTQQKVYARFIQVRPAGASQPPLCSHPAWQPGCWHSTALWLCAAWRCDVYALTAACQACEPAPMHRIELSGLLPFFAGHR